MPKPSAYDLAVDVYDDTHILSENPLTGRVERTTPQRVSRAGISPLNGPLDCGGQIVHNHRAPQSNRSGGHTFVATDGGKTHVHLGGAVIFNVPALRPIGQIDRTISHVVHNLGTGAITLAAQDGVVIHPTGATSIPVGATASLEWLATADTAYCIVRITAP